MLGRSNHILYHCTFSTSELLLTIVQNFWKSISPSELRSSELVWIHDNATVWQTHRSILSQLSQIAAIFCLHLATYPFCLPPFIPLYGALLTYSLLCRKLIQIRIRQVLRRACLDWKYRFHFWKFLGSEHQAVLCFHKFTFPILTSGCAYVLTNSPSQFWHILVHRTRCTATILLKYSCQVESYVNKIRRFALQRQFVAVTRAWRCIALQRRWIWPQLYFSKNWPQTVRATRIKCWLVINMQIVVNVSHSSPTGTC